MKKNNLLIKLATYVVLLAASWAILAPLSIMLFSSLKSKKDLLENPTGLPSEWIFSNYAAAWEKGNMIRNSFNSIIVTGFSVAIVVVFGSLAAYAITRIKVGSIAGWTLSAFMLGLILPASAGLIPLFTQIHNMGLFDTRTGLILIYSAQCMSMTVFIFSKFFITIPSEIEESARMDGLNHWKTFWIIIVPLVLPATVTVIIINTLSVWNDFFNALVFLSTPEKQTLPLGLIAFKGQFSTDWSQLFAASIIIAFPILLLYLFLQRYLIDGLTAGSVKG
ncbi:carbohydrate ABC transporter permease [Paenibacillus wynnii]|uniref:ABC transmembrane type-1 domain-containing protein n=1 Tax=Paenibacillus wynnii TaxID=268407 RepID=A0A098M9S6_9BACL|nr:carbohydrate ABC transporter permease [Paenibacillus wynnii]KGE18798.1 hypothetical protein PWYN_05010 [Paenibacillus wynnii]